MWDRMWPLYWEHLYTCSFVQLSGSLYNRFWNMTMNAWHFRKHDPDSAQGLRKERYHLLYFQYPLYSFSAHCWLRFLLLAVKRGIRCVCSTFVEINYWYYHTVYFLSGRDHSSARRFHPQNPCSMDVLCFSMLFWESRPVWHHHHQQQVKAIEIMFVCLFSIHMLHYETLLHRFHIALLLHDRPIR